LAAFVLIALSVSASRDTRNGLRPKKCDRSQLGIAKVAMRRKAASFGPRQGPFDTGAQGPDGPHRRGAAASATRQQSLHVGPRGEDPAVPSRGRPATGNRPTFKSINPGSDRGRGPPTSMYSSPRHAMITRTTGRRASGEVAQLTNACTATAWNYCRWSFPVSCGSRPMHGRFRCRWRLPARFRDLRYWLCAPSRPIVNYRAATGKRIAPRHWATEGRIHDLPRQNP